jgi:toxin ParE1/3/4
MSNMLIIRKRAETQVEEAFHWYERKKRNLGDDFLEAIEESLTAIELNPQAFQLKYKEIRAVYTKRFPYGVFYIVVNKRIIIMAVFHLSRNPKLWRKLGTK